MEDDKQYDIFLNSLPYLFANEPSKYLITHYMWDSDDNLQQLLVHVRLYDLIRRIYRIKTREEPSKQLIINTIKNINKKRALRNYFKKYIIDGHFPKLQRIKN